MNEEMTVSAEMDTINETFPTTQMTETIEPEVVEPKGNNLIKKGLIVTGITLATGLAIKLYNKCKIKKAEKTGEEQTIIVVQPPVVTRKVIVKSSAPAQGQESTEKTPETK
jgi:hypothetical protein